MSDWAISDTAALAQLRGLLARADTGSGSALIALYSTTQPPIAATHADTPQATITLAKPCGAIVSGALVLYVADTAGSMVQAGGIPRWAEWRAADGAVLARCDVTDMDHGGGIRIAGAGTPAGDTSPVLYAGGLVQLGLVALS